MNLSGNAVSRLMRPNRLSPDRILVVYDDTALSPGALRFRPGGSAGGHNGIKSIIEYLGTEAFPRSGSGWGPPPPGSIWRTMSWGLSARRNGSKWKKSSKLPQKE